MTLLLAVDCQLMIHVANSGVARQSAALVSVFMFFLKKIVSFISEPPVGQVPPGAIRPLPLVESLVAKTDNEMLQKHHIQS